MSKSKMSRSSLITPTLLAVTESTDHLSATLELLKPLSTWSNLKLPDADTTVINQEGERITIEQVRDLIQNSAYPPYQRPERALLLLHLEQASQPAQQALLKLLEEPPRYLRIIATTNQLTAILPTIQSRCSVIQTFETHTSEIDPEIQALSQKIDHLSYGEIINLSEQYKDKTEAETFLKTLILAIKSSPAYPSAEHTTQIMVIAEHLNRLGQNANVRLTIENCFFQLNVNYSA